MRLVIAACFNALLFAYLVVTAPLRLLARRRRPTFVRFKLTGDPPYRRRAGRRWWWPRRDPAAVDSLETLRRQLGILAGDPSVRGVLFHVDGLAVPAAKRAAIAEMFQRLRQSGKEILGFAVSASTAEYELLCAMDRILMAPPGRLELTGLAAELTAIGGGLERLGVHAEFIRRGDYKTAPELFTRETVSEIQRESIDRFLDERYREAVSVIASGRRVTEEKVRVWVDQGPYSARRAQREGLIDELCAERDLPSRLVEGPGQSGAQPVEANVGTHDDALSSYARYVSTLVRPPVRWRSFGRKPRISVVPINGMIVPGDGAGLPGGPSMAGSEGIIKAIQGAADDRRAAAVVLFINSPGGSALASELILDEVKRASKKKTILSYFDRVAASGGYMAALGGTEIWAAPHAVAGSIGVFAGKFDASGLFAKLGIQRVVLTRGENAAMLSSARGFTEHERRALEADVEETYQSFLDHVASARSRTKDEIHALAEGRVYSGLRAKEAGLVDGVSGFDAACRRGFELAGKPLSPSADYEVAIYSPPVRRFPSLAFFQSAARWTLYALWSPWVHLPE